MLTTLFYDDVETDSVLRIPYSPLNGSAENLNEAENLHLSKKHYVVNRLPQDTGDLLENCNCSFHGTLDIPEVDAVLLWWISGCNVLNILAVNDRSATSVSHSSHCQILPIELPISSFSELLTCGISRQSYGGQCITVSWVTKSFHCGLIGVLVQREGCGLSSAENTIGRSSPIPSPSPSARNTRGKVLLIVDHQRCVNGVSLTDVQRAFASEGCGGSPGSSPNIQSRAQEEDNNDSDDLEINACVLSAVPGREVGSVFMITNGESLWRVMLQLDGHVRQDAFVDNKRYERNKTYTSRDDHVAQEGLLALMDKGDLLHCPNLQNWPSLQQIARENVSNISLSPFSLQHKDIANASFGGEKMKSSSWLSSFFSGRSRMHSIPSSDSIPGVIPKHRYLSVSSVLNSPGWFALLRWDGLLEFYDGTSEECEQLVKLVSTCRVSGITELSSNTSFRQWSRLSPENHVIDVVTSVTSRPAFTPLNAVEEILGEQRVFFTSVPTNMKVRVENNEEPDEIIALRNSVELSPPFPSCALMSCTTSSVTNENRKLTLLWAALPLQTNESTTQHSFHRRSIAALLQNELPAFARKYQSILQTLETSEIQEPSFRSTERTAIASRTFFADGASLGAVHTHNNMTLLVEKYMDYHRLHATEYAPELSIEGLMESVTLQPPQRILFQSPDELLESKFPSKGLRSVHLTPSDSPPCNRADFSDEFDESLEDQEKVDNKSGGLETSQLLPATAFSAFFAILEALERHSDGAGLIVDVMREILEGRTSLLTVDRFKEELKLDSFLAKKFVTPSLVRKGLQAALTYVLPNTTHQKSFFNFSRYYVYHNISRCLLHRLAFVSCLYIGWCSSGVPLNNAEPLCAHLLLALEYLSAAFFVSQTTGPELVTLGARLATVVQKGEPIDYKDAVLSTFLSTDALQSTPEPLIDRCLQIALSLYGCSKGQYHNCVTLVPRCVNALEVWVSQMSRRVPILNHFLLLKELEAGRINNTSEMLLPLCWQVMEAISALPSASVVIDVLLNKGLLMTDCTGNSTSFSGMRLDDLQELLLSYTEVAPKLYAIGLLRRLVAPRGAVLLASPSCVSTFFLAELLTVLQCVEVIECESSDAEHSRLPQLIKAPVQSPFRGSCLSSVVTGLKELHVDVLLALSVAAWEDGEVSHAFHHIENAYRIISKASCLAVRAEDQSSSQWPLHIMLTNRSTDLNRVVNDIVHRICHSFSLAVLNDFHNIPSLSPTVEEWITEKWADEILCCADEAGGMSAENQMDYREEESFRSALIYGLYRFFIQRHAYGQCGRVMSSLATALRCSPWCRQRSPVIARLTSLALHSIQMINTISQIKRVDKANIIHLIENDDANENMLSMDKSGCRSGSCGSSERALSPADLPWLNLRVHQTECEASLWSLGFTMDSWVDLWVEDAPYDNVCHAAMHLLDALQSHSLWIEAFRFSVLFNAAYCTRGDDYSAENGNAFVIPDPCIVLKRWAVHILRLPVSKFSNDYSSAVSILDAEGQWDALLGCCAECSSLENQFLGFHSTVTAALRTDYMKTSPRLLEAYKVADPYCALKTLLQIYSSFQTELSDYSVVAEDCSSIQVKETNDAEIRYLPFKNKLTLLSCLACIDAAYIALEVLGSCVGADSSFCFTAGVFDSLALALEHLRKSSSTTLKSVDKDNIHQLFLNKFSEFLESRAIP